MTDRRPEVANTILKTLKAHDIDKDDTGIETRILASDIMVDLRQKYIIIDRRDFKEVVI